MYTVTRQDVRPNLDVPFVTPELINMTASFRLYLSTEHVDKFVNISSEMSPDGLTQTTTVIFSSKDAYFAFQHDSEVVTNLLNKHNEYNDANGIVRTILSAVETL